MLHRTLNLLCKFRRAAELGLDTIYYYIIYSKGTFAALRQGLKVLVLVIWYAAPREGSYASAA